MHIYTKCRFCRADIPGANIREAFCNKDCKLHKEVYGSVSNYKKNKKSGKKPGSRKTTRTQSKQSPKPLRDAVQASKMAHKANGSKKGKLPLSVPVKASNGQEYNQFILIMDYGEVAPRILTGGAIPIQTGGKNEED
jgi:ribosomal protein L44E